MIDSVGGGLKSGERTVLRGRELGYGW